MRYTHNDDELRQAYEKALSGYWLRLSRVSAKVALVMVPAGVTLDYVVYPERVGDFLAFRIACSGMILLAFLFYIKGDYRRVRNLTFAWLFLIQLMISYMIFETEGAMSLYYAGLNLPILAVGIVLPASLIEAILFCCATFAVYAISCLAAMDALEFNRVLYNNYFFLVATATITMISAYFNENRRFSEYQLNYELDLRNKELAELDRQKTEFFANISHELRTPLTLILAPVQEILESGRRLPDSLAAHLGIVRDNGLRLLKLVNDLLDVIRMEEGMEQLDRIPVEINGIVAAMVDGMVHLAETKEIELTKHLAGEQLIVQGDTRALEKIIVNLLSNAIKFTDKGGRIEVETRRRGTQALIRVRDTGIGIPRSELSHIFDRFHQVDGSSTRRYKGTGLGLALVREMAERLDGTVDVESTPGAGTEMTICLPLHEGEGDEVRPEESGQDDGLERLHRLAERMGGIVVEEPRPAAGSEFCDPEEMPGLASVLVVEDEPDMRRYLVDLLEPDYRVLQARTGSDGLRQAVERAPDLVLLDLMLPELDGLEICRRIRSETRLRQPKVMLLTARVDERSKLDALQQGADDFLTKPFSSVEVKTRLRNLLLTARLEQDLVERNRRLEGTLEELRQTQGQLIQSEKLNALGSLAAGLLHEINNPLNYSLTALQLIGGDPVVRDSPLLNEVVGDIDEGMQRIRAIVTDLRAFAYPSEAEKQRPFDFREALESALRFTSHDLKGVEVEEVLPEDTRVLGSKSHVVQVLVNLFNNAARAVADEGEGRIRVRGESRDGRLRVEVQDNGVGMDEVTLARVFDPFFTTRDVGQGMGLGLSICHTIVANHGGRLEAESSPGEGTRMRFDLPLAGDGSA